MASSFCGERAGFINCPFAIKEHRRSLNRRDPEGVVRLPACR
jgi:hypothetical protein